MLQEIVDRRASLIEQVFEGVRGSTLEALITDLGIQGIETTEAELAVVLDYLKARGRILDKDGSWYVV